VETRARALGDRVDIGVIALGCALGYLDFRYASLGWREKHHDTAAWFDRFDSRASMMSTRPPAG
jgi:glutathione S-transferase